MNSNAGDSIEAANARWSFGGEVPKFFEEHVNKSVPLYSEGHNLILKLSDFFLPNPSICYDIGCSTGLLARQLALRNKGKSVQVIGVDAEQGMISHAQSVNNDLDGIEFIKSDIVEFEFKKTDMIIAYYTIQFISPRVRQIVINKIFEALNWGGAFVFFEKVRSSDARFQDIASSIYVDYKLENGYTPDNIIAKARSLKGVLEPFSTQGNLDLLTRAGFKDIATIMKYVSFEGFLAIK